MSFGVGHTHGSDPELLWLWCRLAAIDPMIPLACVALEKTEKKKKKARI